MELGEKRSTDRSTNSLGANTGEPWLDHFKSFKYAFNSLGVGLTAGYELIKNNSQSLLLQIDATITQNNLDVDINPKGEYNTLFYHYNSYQNKFFSPLKQSNRNIIPVISGSLSWVFFKPPSASKDSYYPLQKSIFNPETGETVNPFNRTSYFGENRFTEKQLFGLAKKCTRKTFRRALVCFWINRCFFWCFWKRFWLVGPWWS